MSQSTQSQQCEIVTKKKILENKRCRITELDAYIKRLYEDNISGRISDERFDKWVIEYEREQYELIDAVNTLEADIKVLELEIVNIDKFLGVVRRYTEMEELTPAIIHEFIEKIIIHEPEQARGNRRQNVEIIYKNIGQLDF